MKLLPFKSSKNKTILKVFFVSLYSCKYKYDPDFIDCSIVSPFLISLSDCPGYASVGRLWLFKDFRFLFSVISAYLNIRVSSWHIYNISAVCRFTSPHPAEPSANHRYSRLRDCHSLKHDVLKQPVRSEKVVADGRLFHHRVSPNNQSVLQCVRDLLSEQNTSTLNWFKCMF